MANTITLPNDKTTAKNTWNRTQQHGQVTIGPEQKMAIIALSLAPAITQGDYPTLKAAIEGIAGIQQVDLLVDGQAPAAATVPDNHDMTVHTNVMIRVDPTPE